MSMFRLEIFDRTGTPLCEINDVSGIRWAYDKQLLFELPQIHPKATRTNLAHFNLVKLSHEWISEPWTGYIYDPSWGSDDETISVTCNPTKMLLSKGLTGIQSFTDRQPGEAIAYLVNQANSEEHTGIYVDSLPATGYKPISIELKNENPYDKIQEVCDKAEIDWYLTFVNIRTHLLKLRPRMGTDRTADIVIQAGFDTDGVPEYKPGVTEFANDITGVGKLPEGREVPEGEDDYNYRPKVRLVDQNSIDRYGRWKAVVDFSDVEDTPTLTSMTQVELDRRAWPVITTTLVLNNRRQLWGSFTDGDVISVQMPHTNFGGVVVPVIVRGREVDPDNDTLTVACEVVQGTKSEALEFLRNYIMPTTPTGHESVPREIIEVPGPLPTVSLTDRVSAALRSRGWRQLGTLFNDAWRESDIIYNAANGYWYVFNSEGDANGLTFPTPDWNIDHTTPNGTNSTLVYLTANHNLSWGTGRKYHIVCAGTGNSGLDSILGKFAACPAANVIDMPVTTSVSYTTGTAHVNTQAQVGMRRATTIEGIVSASGSDYISRVAAGLYYPSVSLDYISSQWNWNMIGTISSGNTRWNKYVGDSPTGSPAFGTNVTLSPVIVDAAWKKNPADNKWYMVGLYGVGGGSQNDIRLYYNTDITVSSGWTAINSVSSISVNTPQWVQNTTPDPNVCFLDGKAYLLFLTQDSATPSTTSRGAIASIDLTTGLIGEDCTPLSYPTINGVDGTFNNATWAPGYQLSDFQLVRGPDGVDRIFGFQNGNYDIVGNVPWGVLELD